MADMRNSIALLCVAATSMAHAQRVLHFTATSGYDHGTRDVSFALFTGIATELGIDVVNDPIGTVLSDASALGEFDAIIFSNTSGNDILDATQRANFEQWVNAGGHVMGIHAASDTYRHSTANGNNTGTWDFFAELIGASVQENPNHVIGTPPYEMTHIGQHASTDNLPDPWLKNEEYYYWEYGYYDPDNTVVLEVEATVGPNGQVNSYDVARPMSWYRELENGSRVFYTALGHAASNYTDDALFHQHVKDALAWMLDGTTAVVPYERITRPTVVNEGNWLVITSQRPGTIRIIDPMGRLSHHAHSNGSHRVATHRWARGLYHITIGDDAVGSIAVH